MPRKISGEALTTAISRIAKLSRQVLVVDHEDVDLPACQLLQELGPIHVGGFSGPLVQPGRVLHDTAARLAARRLC